MRCVARVNCLVLIIVMNHFFVTSMYVSVLCMEDMSHDTTHVKCFH